MLFQKIDVGIFEYEFPDETTFRQDTLLVTTSYGNTINCRLNQIWLNPCEPNVASQMDGHYTITAKKLILETFGMFLESIDCDSVDLTVK